MVKRAKITVSEEYKIESELNNFIIKNKISQEQIISIQERFNSDIFIISVYYKIS